MKHILPFLFLLLTPLIVVAQVTQYADGVQLVELAVTPQKVPVPALKYKLTWGFDQRVKNNAAIQYNSAMRALHELKLWYLSVESQKFEEDYRRLFTDSEFFNEKKGEHDAFEKMLQNLEDDPPKSADTLLYEASLRYKAEAYADYAGKPKNEFPVEEARKFVERFYYAYRHLKSGSRCDVCDWEYPIRGNRDILAMLLPEMQDARDLARGLAIKARVEIYDKNYDAAIETLRVGKTLARHVAEGCPVMIGNLIGISIDSIMNECLLELVQQPDAPNLYWTLTTLPDSPAIYADSFDVEMDFLRLMFPELARAMDDPDGMTENDWKEFNRVLLKAISSFENDKFVATSLIASGWGITAYPKAKQWLASQGKTPEEIENMPVAQAIGLWSVYRYEIVRDEHLKIVRLPFWQKEKFNYDKLWNEFEVATPLDAVVRMLFPALSAYHHTICRSQAGGDVLRIVEAIRLYAAENDGKLPETLDAILSVPIPPVDPFTGKPYTYRIENGRAVIEYNPGYCICRTVVTVNDK